MRRLPFFPDGPPQVLIEPGTGEALDPDSSCTRCNAYKGARTPCIPPVVMPGRDPGAPTLLVIGDRVGQQEDLAGRAFASAAGQYLRREVEKLWHGPIAYTNAVNCCPSNKKISPAMVRECRVYLRKLMEDLQPARVLVLGAQAARSVVDVALPPLSTRGAYARTSAGAPVFFLGNPADTARNSFVKKWFEEDLRHALVAEPATTPWNGAALLVENEADAVEACTALREACDFDARTLSVDLEWYGYCGDNDFRVLTIGLSVGEDAYVWDEGVLGPLRVDDEDLPCARPNAIVEPMLELMRDPGIPKSAHAAKGDLRGFWFGFGVDVQGFQSCTRLFRKIEQADSYAYLEDLQALVGMAGWKGSGISASDEAVVALNTAAGEDLLLVEQAEQRRLLGSKLTPKIETGMQRSLERQRKSADKERASWVGAAADFQSAVKRVISGRAPQAYMYGGVDAETRARYCAQDTVSQQALLRLLEPRVERDKGYSRVWRQVTRPFHRAVLKMECNGLRIDVEAAKKVQAYLGDKLLTAQYAVKDVAGEDFNPNASAQVAALLGKMGAPLGRPGKSGVPCVDKDVLKGLITAQDRNGRPQPYAEIALRLTEVRRYTKLKGTYADGFLLRVTDDGYLHPNINIDGTECLPAGELVLTARGYLPVQDVRVGDTVLAHTGFARQVTRIAPQPAATVIRVRLANGLELVTTGAHEYRTKFGGWVRADMIGVGQELVTYGASEEWRRVEGWPYEVSSWGRVRSDRYGLVTLQGGDLLGRLSVTLKRNGARKRGGGDIVTRRVHKLVADAFYGGMPYVRHRNGYAWDNNTHNLQPGTAKENTGDARRHGTLSHREGSRQTKLTQALADAIRATPRAAVPDLVWAERLGVSRELVRDVRLGKRWMPEEHVTGKPADTKFGTSAVVAVEYAGERVTYGLTVDTDHSHVTAGIVTHNSGRPSSEDPNTLNLPRPKTIEGKMIRDMILADLGWWLLEVDQSQVEFRKAGVMSGDRVMLEMFEAGVDFHTATAKLVAPLFGVKPEDVDDGHWLRDAAKTINFAILYGDTVEGTAHKLNVTVRRAQEIRDAILGKFKDLARWIKEMLSFARRSGYCVIPWQGQPGLRRPLWKIVSADKGERETAERGSWNTPVQGAAALITNASCGGFQKWIDDTGTKNHKLLLTVYDSILVGSRDGYVEEASEVLDGICCQWHPILRIDRKVGKSWGSMKAPPKAA